MASSRSNNNNNYYYYYYCRYDNNDTYGQLVIPYLVQNKTPVHSTSEKQGKTST